MRNERSIALVFGYLRNIDRFSKTARRLALPARFSIALDTYRSALGEMHFDLDLFVILFTPLLRLIPHDAVSAVSSSREELHFKNTADAFACLREMCAAENTPFDSIKLLHGGTVVCYIETEYYMATGGPEPYHDTYNFAVFLRQYDRTATEQCITGLCMANDIHIRTIITGSGQAHRSLTEWLKGGFKISP